MVFFLKYITRSFIHTGYIYSTSSSPLLHRGAPDTARILCRSFTPKRHRQLRVNDLPKVPTCWLEWDSKPRPFGRKALNLPTSHPAPQLYLKQHNCPPFAHMTLQQNSEGRSCSTPIQSNHPRGGRAVGDRTIVLYSTLQVF